MLSTKANEPIFQPVFYTYILTIHAGFGFISNSFCYSNLKPVCWKWPQTTLKSMEWEWQLNLCHYIACHLMSRDIILCSAIDEEPCGYGTRLHRSLHPVHLFDTFKPGPSGALSHLTLMGRGGGQMISPFYSPWWGRGGGQMISPFHSPWWGRGGGQMISPFYLKNQKG